MQHINAYLYAETKGNRTVASLAHKKNNNEPKAIVYSLHDQVSEPDQTEHVKESLQRFMRQVDRECSASDDKESEVRIEIDESVLPRLFDTEANPNLSNIEWHVRLGQANVYVRLNKASANPFLDSELRTSLRKKAIEAAKELLPG